jgi:hypothetical protein
MTTPVHILPSMTVKQIRELIRQALRSGQKAITIIVKGKP